MFGRTLRIFARSWAFPEDVSISSQIEDSRKATLRGESREGPYQIWRGTHCVSRQVTDHAGETLAAFASDPGAVETSFEPEAGPKHFSHFSYGGFRLNRAGSAARFGIERGETLVAVALRCGHYACAEACISLGASTAGAESLTVTLQWVVPPSSSSFACRAGTLGQLRSKVAKASAGRVSICVEGQPLAGPDSTLLLALGLRDGSRLELRSSSRSGTAFETSAVTSALPSAAQPMQIAVVSFDGDEYAVTARAAELPFNVLFAIAQASRLSAANEPLWRFRVCVSSSCVFFLLRVGSEIFGDSVVRWERLVKKSPRHIPLRRAVRACSL